MASILSSSDKRQNLANQIDALTNQAIDWLKGFREGLPRGDKTRALLDVGESLVGMARLSVSGNAEVAAMTKGVKDSGLAWLIRLVGRAVNDLIQKSPSVQLAFIAGKLREVATVLDDVAKDDDMKG